MNSSRTVPDAPPVNSAAHKVRRHFHGNRATFVSRAVLAATMSPSWGIYGPAFELFERSPVRPGSEEYLSSEKYQLRQWDLDRDDSLAPLITRLNAIRRNHPAMAYLDSLRYHHVDND